MVSSPIKNSLIDEDIDDVSQEKHRQLLQTITSKTKRKIQPTTRNEPSLQVSEFHLSSGQQSTNVNDLTNVLKKKAPRIRQKIQVVNSTKKLLQKPLDKVHAEKIKRAVAYGNFKKHISRWSAVIEKNKAADQLQFPLKSNEVKVFDNRMVDFTKGFSQPTDLQKKITDILQSSEIIQQKQNNLKISWMEKEKEKYPLTLKELLEKRKTMAKFRAQESYRHAKAHRQNKIKSKKYHRLLRKEKTKEQIKEFEKLQDTDPVAALDKLNVIEKTRAEERASLRHKSTGQWARNHVVRAKYDKESRIALAEQLRKSKELTQKVGPSLNDKDDSDYSNDEQIEIIEQVIDPDNPWLAEKKEFTNFIAGYKSFVKQNYDNDNNNGQNQTNINLEDNDVKFDENKIDKTGDYNIDESDKKKEINENIFKNKVKSIKIQDLSLCDEESDVDILKIIDPREIENKSSNVKFKSKVINKNINIGSTTLNGKKKNEVKVIHTVSGIWFVSSDADINSKKNKIHKDVENTFKNIDSELKNRINKKLVNINKSDVQISNKVISKRKVKKIDSNYLKMNVKRTKAEFNEPLYENGEILEDIRDPENVIDNQTLDNTNLDKSLKQVQNIDPTKFLKVSQTNLDNKEMPHVEDHLDDNDNEQEKLIAEAFADDDIINEFKEEKKKLEEKSKPKIETSLPGWGSWGGPNIRKRMFRKKTNMGMFRIPAKPPRKDFNREKVIIHENADDSIKSHLVSELPYPFKNVEEYEETIKVPVGRTWIPETVFHKLIAPPVVTQMGQIIDPIDENSVVKLNILND